MQNHRSGAEPLRAIVLTGFMGAGKTTVGRMLAEDLGWDFRDLDAEIEKDAGMTVAAIFRREGEAAFRTREAAMLSSLLSKTGHQVLALGGGTMESASSRELLAVAKGICTIYLSAPLEALVQRCLEQPGAAERPVLADRERLHTRWSQRLPYYEQSHLRVETSTLSPRETAQHIQRLLGERLMPGHARVSAP